MGDTITITLNEKTQAAKKANQQVAKNSKTGIGLTSLFGGSGTTLRKTLFRARREWPLRA